MWITSPPSSSAATGSSSVHPKQGSYSLVTSADDRAMIVWSFDPKTCALLPRTRTTSIFTSSPNSTFYRSLSCSSDGQWIAIGNASNGDAHVATLVPTDLLSTVPVLTQQESSRQAGSKTSSSSTSSTSVPLIKKSTIDDKQISLVGHVTPIEIVSFAPCLLEDPQAAPKSSQSVTESFYYLIATGSQDGTLCLWSSNQERPIVVLDGLFEHAVMSLAWRLPGGAAGTEAKDQRAAKNLDQMMLLMAVSYDGTIAFVYISKEVIGTCCRQEATPGNALADRELPTGLKTVLTTAIPQRASQAMADNAVTLTRPLATSAASVKGPRRVTPQLVQSLPQLGRDSKENLLPPSMPLQTPPLVDYKPVYEPRQAAKRFFPWPMQVIPQLGTREELLVERDKQHVVSVHSREGKQCLWKQQIYCQGMYVHNLASSTLPGQQSKLLYLIDGPRLLKVSLLTGRWLQRPITFDSDIVDFGSSAHLTVVLTSSGLMYVLETGLVIPLPTLQDKLGGERAKAGADEDTPSPVIQIKGLSVVEGGDNNNNNKVHVDIYPNLQVTWRHAQGWTITTLDDIADNNASPLDASKPVLPDALVKRLVNEPDTPIHDGDSISTVESLISELTSSTGTAQNTLDEHRLRPLLRQYVYRATPAFYPRLREIALEGGERVASIVKELLEERGDVDPLLLEEFAC